MTTPTPEVFVVGAGPVGTAIALRLSRAGIPVAGIHARRPEQAAAAGSLAGVLGSSGDYPHILSESDIVVVAVRDDGIAEVTRDLVAHKVLRREQVLLHCSGALAAAEALAPARGKVRGLGTLHPLVSFADAQLAGAALRGAAMTIEGDAAGREAARTLAQALGGVVHEIEGSAMALYHAAAVIACNYAVVLADAGAELLTRAGYPREAALTSLLPLLGGTVRNLAELGVPRALTGPIARGEASVVERHLAVLESEAPELLGLYREAGRRAVAIARSLGETDASKLDRIGELLGAEPATTSKTPDAGRGKPRARPRRAQPRR